MIDLTWVFEESFNHDLINKVKDLAVSTKVSPAQVMTENGGYAIDKVKRVSNVCFIEDEAINAEIWAHILKANANNFGFDLVKDFNMQFGEYKEDDKGFYDWHADQGLVTNKLIDRKLSIVVQLTDPSEYEGGQLEFNVEGNLFTPNNFEKKGSVIVFPAFYMHRVTPVTKGVRNSLVAWVNGPNFR